MNAEIENAAKFLGCKVLLRKLPSPEQLLVKDDLVGVQSQQPDDRTGISQIERIKGPDTLMSFFGSRYQILLVCNRLLVCSPVQEYLGNGYSWPGIFPLRKK